MKKLISVLVVWLLFSIPYLLAWVIWLSSPSFMKSHPIPVFPAVLTVVMVILSIVATKDLLTFIKESK